MQGLVRTSVVVLLVTVAARASVAQSDLISYQNHSAYANLSGRVRALAFEYGGNVLAAAGDDRNIALYDVPTRRQRVLPVRDGPVLALAFSRDDNWLAAGTQHGTVVLWDVSSGQPRPLAGHHGAVRAVAFSPANDLLASAGEDKQIVLWSTRTGQEVGRLQDGHSRTIRFIAFVGRGDAMLSVGEDRQIIYWDVKNKTRIRQSTEIDPAIFSATASPGTEWLVLGTELAHGTVRSETRMEPIDPRAAAGRMPVARQQTDVEMTYRDRIKFYNTQTGFAEKIINNIVVEPRSISVSADYKYVAVAQRDVRVSSVGIWDVDRGVQVGELPVSGKVTEVAFSPNGAWLSYGDERGQVSVLEVKGVFPRAAAVADLTGRKYSLTSSPDPLVRPSRRLRFAVLDLDHQGVDDFVAAAIADELTNKLAQNRGVRLVERRRIEQVMKEQNFEHSGRTDAASATRLARVLNVQKVIMGSVSKLGTTMTVYAQLVDVETAAIEGTKEMVCRNCTLEDLPMAVAEMSSAIVAPADPALRALPPPPTINIDYPHDGAEVRSANLTLHGQVGYSSDLEGIELIVNGKPYPAERIFAAPTEGRMTRLAGGSTFSFVQNVPLEDEHNIIAVRALTRDGNDEQRYLSIHRVGQIASTPPDAPSPRNPQRAQPPRRLPPPSAQPAVTLQEVEQALSNGVPQDRVGRLVHEFGVDFTLSPPVEQRLRGLGISNGLLLEIGQAKKRK